MALNQMQSLFVHHYSISKNATEAAKLAGYSEKTAYSIGWELLKKPEIKAAIDALNDEEKKKLQRKLEKAGITKERWLLELAAIAFANMDDYARVGNNSVNLIPTADRKRSLGRAIKKISESTNQHGGSQSIELHPKIPALDLIGKHMGWLKEKMELSGPDGKPVQTLEVTEQDVKAAIAKIESEF